MVNIKKIIKKLEPYVPGKSINEIVKKYGLKNEDIIKLGSNENPLGPSPKAKEAIKKALPTINQYPETGLQDLKRELSKYCKTNEENIIVGGDGADEIIEILGKTFIDPDTEFIVPLPSYMYYEYILQMYEGKPIYAKWNIEDNCLDVNSVLDLINDNTRLIFLCTPNNPTGGIISKKDIESVIKSTDALVIIDEAYIEFADGNNVDLISKYPNVFIMRTFSKVLGLAGMRIGYGISNSEIIEYMHRTKPAFSLTKLSHVAALATIKDKKYIEESTKYSIKSREYLYQKISNINKLTIYPSKSNYLLIDVRETGQTATQFSEELLKNGVIVRDCTSFKGLDEYWIRASVGTMEENKKFIEILEKIITKT